MGRDIASRIEMEVTNGLGYGRILHYDDTEAELIRHLFAMQLRVHENATGRHINLGQDLSVSSRARYYEWRVNQLRNALSSLDKAYDSSKVDRKQAREIGEILDHETAELSKSLWAYLGIHLPYNEYGLTRELIDNLSSVGVELGRFRPPQIPSFYRSF